MTKINIPWSPELVEKIYNEKVSWVEDSTIPIEEKQIELERLREWRDSALENKD